MEFPKSGSGDNKSRRGLKKSNWKVRILSALLVSMPNGVFAAGSLVTDPDLLDNRFEVYILQPCLDGPAALFARGWTIAEFQEYDNAVCNVVFSGSFNSSDYASTTNTGSVAAQSKASDTLAQQQVDSVQDRLDEIKQEDAEESGGGWGLLLSVQKGESERVSTNDEVGYDSDLDGVVIGGDYRLNDSMVLGFAVGNTTDDAAFDGDSGSLETDSQSLLVYTTYVLSDNAYIDGYFGLSSLEYSTERDISIDGEAADAFGFSGTVESESDGEQLLFGVSAGYDWYRGKYSYGVSAGLDYSETDVDDYVEQGSTGLELEFEDQSSKSLTLSLGVTGSFSIDMGWGIMVPNLSVSAVREAENDSRSFDARLVVSPAVDTTALTLETDSPDRSYLITSLGLVVAMNSGTQYFVTYEELSSHDFLETSALSAGLLLEF